MVFDDSFLSELSHEARSPLATLRGVVMTLEQVPEMPEADRAEFLRIIDRESARLGALFEDLLALLRLGGGGPVVARAPEDLAAVLREAREPFDALLAAAGIALELGLPNHPVWVSAAPGELEQLATRLVGAVLRVVPERTRLALALGTGDGRARLTLACPGVAALAAGAQSGRVRGAEGSPVVRSVPQAGLGLVLVKALCEAQGGRFGEPSPGGALAISWPLAAS